MSKDERLDSLLSRGRLSGPERDRIFAGALAGSGRRLWRRVVPWTASLAAAAALFLFLRTPGFHARGGGGPVLEVACQAGPPCRAGSTLLFRVGGALEGGFLHAWAEPLDGGERIWYFPTADGQAQPVPPGAEMQTLPEGVRLTPGRYRVHLVLAARPLAREALLAQSATGLATAQTLLEVAP